MTFRRASAHYFSSQDLDCLNSQSCEMSEVTEGTSMELNDGELYFDLVSRLCSQYS